MTTITHISQYKKLLTGLQDCSKDEKVAIVRHLCRTDLFFLIWFGFNRLDIYDPWLFERCREVQNSPNGHLDLWAREHYKSTIITYALTIQDILSSHGDNPDPKWNGIEPTFGIFSHTRPIAKGFLRQIKRELEGNELLKSHFPDVLFENPQKEAGKWSEDDGIVVRRKSNPKESTVEAWGIVDGQPTSKHFTIMVYDDVVTKESVNTAEMIKKTTESWELSINLGSRGGFERYIGTRYHENDTYETMLERGATIPRVYAATKDGQPEGEPVFLTKEELSKKLLTMGSYTFACQMLQSPIAQGDALFKREDFKRYDLDDLPDNVNKFGASDYAVTQDGGDFTEHGIAGFDHEENLYLIDGWSGQQSPDIWIDEQIKLMKEHNPYAWVAEGGVIRRSIEPFLIKRMEQTKAYTSLEWITSNKNKVTNLTAFRGLASMGKVYIPNTAWGDSMIEHLIRFPYGKYDDKADICGLFGRILDQTWAANLPSVIKKKKRDIYGYKDHSGSNWKTV
jgi:predicted phage terminase large subunit-like protein